MAADVKQSRNSARWADGDAAAGHGGGVSLVVRRHRDDGCRCRAGRSLMPDGIFRLADAVPP